MKLDACYNWATCSDDAVARAVELEAPDGKPLKDDLHGARPACPVYIKDGDACDLARWKPGENGALSSPQGGLRISARGLARVGRMLLNGGTLDGVRILSPQSVETMLTPLWRYDGRNGSRGGESTTICAYGLSTQPIPNHRPGCPDDPGTKARSSSATPATLTACAPACGSTARAASASLISSPPFPRTRPKRAPSPAGETAAFRRTTRALAPLQRRARPWRPRDGRWSDFYRIRRLPPYVFAEVNAMKAAARARGEDIIDLGMGNPDGAPPKHVIDKLCEVAAKPNAHRYSASRGIPGLRKAQAGYYQRRFGVTVDPDKEVIVTLGSKEGPRQPRPGDHRAGRRRARAQPELPDPHLRLHHRRRRDPLDPGRARRGLLPPPRNVDALQRAAAQGAGGRLSVQPDRLCRRPRFLRAARRLRARA